VTRFPDRNHFASWTGTAPLDASSGDQIRHRLSRAGNRRMNHVLHIAAIVQIRHDTEGRAYYRRKLAESKTPMEALRCLKRRLSDVVYRQLVADAQAAEVSTSTTVETGPGGHSGASSQSSAADLSTPVIGSSDQPLPGPANQTLPPATPVSNPPRGLDSQSARRRAGAVKVQRPTGRTTLTATNAGAHSTAPRPRT
jgi:transposase